MEVNFQTSFNARNLDPKEVAEKFIFSPSFDKLKNNCHTVILGARGCGKTTLMKMLTLPALHNWNNPNAKKIIDEIPFYAVYIPTDISWILKEESFKNYDDDDIFKKSISKFAVNTNLFESLCDTFYNILKYELTNSEEEKEFELCMNLIERWKLKKSTVPKLQYIKTALQKRRDDVSQKIPKAIFNRTERQLIDEDYFELDYKTSVTTVTTIFNRIYNIPTSKKMALCFDELEFAPAWLKKELYERLRSTDQNLLFKLSSSPLLPKEVEEIMKSESGASFGNDFEAIKMWELQSNNEFPRKIIESLLVSKSNFENLESFFGSNIRYIKKLESYTKDSIYIKEIKELQSKDEMFRDFLIKNSINPINPIPVNEDQKSSIYRKMKPIVYFRNYFLRENRINGKPILKPNKKYIELYSGLEVLINITDGNPRWLIGLINSILNNNNGNRVENNVQYDEIIKVSNRFINFIKNTPITLKDSKSLTTEKFIDKIGNYFQNELLGYKFQPEPISSFTFDLNNSIDYENIIEKGLLQGAFILVGSEKEIYDFEINNKRFKLSNLFYPRYKLPLRMNKTIKLSSIFTNTFENNKPNLFNEYEN
ncbi:ORC-CDC6 family AAA ATPase [Flavobacterium oreochromis]|uniref:Uncharacterized protein n=1 Tax=Flavobacterium columnare TaxID=996 RepID=A0A2D0AHU5_9FLAO|nr:hypothetical protein [Flavobacterium oreochromis]OWP77680.1 hypothetical protein BWK62_06935 [Flavobacterium oreochromis]